MVSENERGFLEDPAAISPAVYNELRALAKQLLHKWHSKGLPQTTSLVHEAYIRLQKRESDAFRDRSHFYAIASRAMRFILVDQSRRRKSLKRGGNHQTFPISDYIVQAEDQCIDLLALDQALKRLFDRDVRKGRIVELRFFGGLSVEETAEVLDISTPTVKRNWAMAKAWLRREMSRDLE